MLTLDRITYTLGARTLLREASMQVGKHDRLALVGLNGVGKSTLFKLIIGMLTPDAGYVSKAKGMTLGFLRQEEEEDMLDQSIQAIVMQGNKRLYDLGKRLDAQLQRLATTHDEATLATLGELQDAFATQGGYTLETEAATLLGGMGFGNSDLAKPLRAFSGGWRMRVRLAQLLLEAPDLLLLDEPTNHLDITAIQWLESYLASYAKAFILISHDRQFLDRATTYTIELVQEQLHRYEGNYTFYLQEKAGRIALQAKAYEQQQQHIRQQERFIQRFRATASKATQVQSVIKTLAKLPRIPPVMEERAKPRLTFPPVLRAGKVVSSGKGVDKAYGEHLLFLGATWELLRATKTALIGANGRGKTTLLKLIAEELAPDGGTITLGHQVKVAFYAQHQLEALDPSCTVLESLEQVATGQTVTELRTLLGAFLFPKEEVEKRVAVLSGGERARVALARLLLSGANFLVLDEPTNHLDIVSKGALKHALKQYEGTLLFVSHDRDFIEGLADHIGYLHDGQVRTYPGDYGSYTFWKQQQVGTARYASLP